MGCHNLHPKNSPCSLWELFKINCVRLERTLVRTLAHRTDSHKEVTRSLLRTGLWEHFLRSLKLEIAFIRRSCNRKLGESPYSVAVSSHGQRKSRSTQPCCISRSTMRFYTPMPLRCEPYRKSYDGGERCHIPVKQGSDLRQTICITTRHLYSISLRGLGSWMQ